MAKKFNPGNWVEVKGKNDSPKMQVIKYISKKDPILNTVNDDNYVECVWYENGDRKTRSFHQKNLINVVE